MRHLASEPGQALLSTPNAALNPRPRAKWQRPTRMLQRLDVRAGARDDKAIALKQGRNFEGNEESAPVRKESG